MRLLTCGSRLEIPTGIIQQFDGVVGGYFWGLWESPTLQSMAQIYSKTEVWNSFLYGNKNTVPDPNSGCVTLEQWIVKRLSKTRYVTHWKLINEFTDDAGNPYQNYGYQNIKSYILAAKQGSPNAKIIISDFRPYLLGKWQKIRDICEQLTAENVPLYGVGIQVHFKTRNARLILDSLPDVIQMFEGICPVHLTEVSGWYHYTESVDDLIPLWNEVLDIATVNNIETFCPWWLNSNDENYPQKMPTFEEFLGAGIYNKDWVKLLELPTTN